MDNKAQLTINSMNNLSGGTVLYERGDAVDSISLLVKGRVEAVSDGVSTVLSSGNFLGVCDVEKKTHTFTYTVKDDAVVYVLAVSGMESIRSLLRIKPEYCGLLVTSLNFFILELKKRLGQLQEENQSFYEFMEQKYILCEETGKSYHIPVDTSASMKRIAKYSQEGVELSDKLEYYCECAGLPVEVQKKYFSGSAYISFFHYGEQCRVIESLVNACSSYGEYLYKYFRNLVVEEDSLFNTIGKLALTMSEQGIKSALVDNAVDEIVVKINEVETFLVEKMGMEIELDRDRMERLYFALLSGETNTEEELEELSSPGIEYLYNSLEQITEYAPVHLRVKSEFAEYVEEFGARRDKFDKTAEGIALRKKISAGFFEIYEAVLLKSFEDTDLPLAVRLFLDFGFVSEKLLTEEDLNSILSLRPVRYEGEDGCRVYTMRNWLKAVYDGVKGTSKNEFDMDYEEYLRQKVNDNKLAKKEMSNELADKGKRLHFECQNMFRYADRVVSGNISSFVPILCSEGIFNNIRKSYLSEEAINQAIKKVEEVDYSIFYRDRLESYPKIDVSKFSVIERITPDVILFPVYGRNCLMWQDITGKKRSSKGRIFMPILFEKELDLEIVRALAAFRWEKCRTEMGNRWNDFRYPSLTSEYSDYLQFYRKNSELSQERRAKIRAQLQQCNNKHKEVFIRDYLDWILRESRGAMKLSRVARAILFTYCPFSVPVYKALEGQTAYSEAAKKYIRENQATRKSLDMVMKKFERQGIDVPKALQDTMEYLKG